VVAIDNQSGGCLATKHLLAQGYQNIGIITGPLDWWESRERLAGWQVTLQEAGKTVNPRQITEGDWSAASGEAGIRKLLAQYPEVDAVFVCNDQMALGVLQAAHRLGWRVPEDLGVVGFDNIPESAYFWPALTTVEQPLLDLGSRAVQELSRLIEADQRDDSIIRSETILLQPKLILRDSSLALHRRGG
jgi:LacI family transcriptional regulator